MDILRDPRAIALLLAASLTIMSNATISPGLPGIEAMFSETPNAALLTRLLVTAPALLIAFVAPFAGMAADRFGRKKQLIFGVGLFAIAGTAGLYLRDLHILLASRLILGFSVALVMTAQAALLGDIFAGEKRGRFMGYQMSAVNFGGFFFIAAAGWLAGLNPIFPFALYGIALLYIPFLQRALPDSHAPEPTGHDGPGASGGEPGWLFTLCLTILLCGLTFALFYVMPTQLPYFLASSGHEDPKLAGLAMGVVVLAAGTASLFFGAIRRWCGRAGTPAAGYVFMSIGFWVLHLSGGLPVIGAGAALVGIGVGIVMPTFVAIALDVAPPHRRGTVSGAITTAIFLGQFVSPFLSQPLIDNLGYRTAFFIGAGVLALFVPAVLVGFRRPRNESGVTA
ncbi:MFS transporter [Pseudoruegeria sp. HB172150]|uniref:MFS transporter n=1 Tax=Pseudoruegeria sp. HB172150 TaxID=2721164 RepID=UPI001555DBC2|nr:MFS transporter [Pseudoruegeria sp. HB172150]